MEAEKWYKKNNMKQQLIDKYHRFSFYQAVSLFESILKKESDYKKNLGDASFIEEECLRFSVIPDISFPPNNINKVTFNENQQQVHMYLSFFGLLGPLGILPEWYNELAILMDRKYKNEEQEPGQYKPSPLTAFINMFQHRLTTFFYLAWKKTQFTKFFYNDSNLTHYLMSLVGLGTKEAANLATDFDNIPLNYCGMISQGIPVRDTIQKIVASHLNTTVKITENMHRLLPLEKIDQTRLGHKDSCLGVDVVCGNFYHDCQSAFQIDIGPISYNEYIKLVQIDNGRKHRSLIRLIQFIAGPEFEFDVNIYILKKEIPQIKLSKKQAPACLLGISTWLVKQYS